MRQCDRGMAGHVWPDGGGLLDQPNVLIEAWNVLGRAMALAKDGKPQVVS